MKQAKWVVKIDQMLRETLKKDKLINFGTHFNIHFTNFEGLTEGELFEKLSKVLEFVIHSSPVWLMK